MVLSIVMTLAGWLFKLAMWMMSLAARGTVSAVALALSMLLKLLQRVPPEEYTKLIVMLETFLGNLVSTLGPTHPASEILAGPPPQILVTPPRPNPPK